MPATITITHFTDPVCPFAFSAEPLLRRLEWQLGDNADWVTRMVGLVDHPDDAAARGLSPQRLTAAYASLAASHAMPFSDAPVTRLFASTPACRAIVATRRHAPAHEARLIRALRVQHFQGNLADEPAALAAAAAQAGLVGDRLESWMAEPQTADALAEDMRLARDPGPAARAQDARLADWSAGRRYTCPSLEFRHLDGHALSAPGFQPWESYDLVVANLAPTLARRPAPTHASEVIAWAPFPLATIEVATIRDADPATVLVELAACAERMPAGTGDYWRAPPKSTDESAGTTT